MASRGRWRSKYLSLQNRLNTLMEGYDCGIALAAFLNPEIGEVQQELDALIKEIKDSQEYKIWKKG